MLENLYAALKDFYKNSNNKEAYKAYKKEEPHEPNNTHIRCNT